MTLFMLTRARELAAYHAVSVEVRFEGGDAEKMAACFGDDLSCRPQGLGDLGRRIKSAFAAWYGRSAK